MLFLGIIRYEQYYDELVAYGDFPTPEGRLACFPSGEARLYGFIHTGGEAAHHNPRPLRGRQT